MDSSTNELVAFHQFVATHLEGDEPLLSPEEAVEAFRTYQRELERFRAETRDALEECEQGKTRPLDVEALKRRVRDRLAEQGIAE